tara:strand:- start:3506 stop:4594 length:1089 start_codon:yes stop_codon:yes gene_type:complete
MADKSSKLTVHSKCTKRNPSPPCKEDYETRKTKKGIDCCYKKRKLTHKKKNKSFIKQGDITVSLNLTSVDILGNTFPIKDKIKASCSDVGYSGRARFTKIDGVKGSAVWNIPFECMYSKQLSDVFDTDLLPTVKNIPGYKNLILFLHFELDTSYGYLKNPVYKVYIGGDTDKIINILKAYHFKKFDEYSSDRPQIISERFTGQRSKADSLWLLTRMKFNEDGEKNILLNRIMHIFGLQEFNKLYHLPEIYSPKLCKLVEKNRKQQIVLRKKKEQLHKKMNEKLDEATRNVEYKYEGKMIDRSGIARWGQHTIKGPQSYVKILTDDILKKYPLNPYGTTVKTTVITKRPKIIESTISHSLSSD